MTTSTTSTTTPATLAPAHPLATDGRRGLLLGVNIDHVATIRQARRARYPEPVAAAMLAERGGADQITVHLREDRRHIIDRDIFVLKELLFVPMNLEMAVTDEMLAIATHVKPTMVTLVPEKREEVTTEGGLDVAGQLQRVASVTRRLQDAGIVVSHFIDPDITQVEAAKNAGANAIELHTGAYADAPRANARNELDRLATAAQFATNLSLHVACGHGLHYNNVEPLARIDSIREYNIGHAIVARAVLVGIEEAVRTMKQLLVGTA